MASQTSFIQSQMTVAIQGEPPPQKNVFFGISFPNVGGWGGWFLNKVQTPQNPPNSPRKLTFSTRISPFVSQISKKTLGWVNTFGKEFPPQKNGNFLDTFPNFHETYLWWQGQHIGSRNTGDDWQLFLSRITTRIRYVVDLKHTMRKLYAYILKGRLKGKHVLYFSKI